MIDADNKAGIRSILDIIHVDMDAFYAAVEERDDPTLVGQPVVVGGDPEHRGVVSTANYIARRFGVKSAMPAGTARRLCPDAIFIRPRMSHYAEVSNDIRDIFHRYTPLVEPLSLDEAFLDVSGCERLHGSTIEIGEKIAHAIHAETRLRASVGVAPNKFLAKLGSDLEKPNGFVVIEAGNVIERLDPLPVSRLWGVGKTTQRKLESLGAYTIRDVRVMTSDTLYKRFGTLGERLYQLSRGIDDRKVVPERDAKSISHETTFSEDIVDHAHIASVLLSLTEDVSRRLRRHDLRAQTVKVKMRHGDFKTIVRSKSLDETTNVTRVLWRTVDEISRQYLGQRRIPLRLLGVGVSGFTRSSETEEHQTELFAEARPTDPIDTLTDNVEQRFGPGTLTRAGALARSRKK